MDRQQFSDALQLAITTVFNQIKDKEHLSHFGIFTNQDVSTLSVGYHCLNQTSNQLLDQKENNTNAFDEWSMPEWDHEIGDENEHINKINDLLYNDIQPNAASLAPDNFKDNLLDLLSTVLLDLKRAGLFDRNKDGILYLEKADSYIGERMKQRIKMLNTQKQYEAFLNAIQE